MTSIYKINDQNVSEGDWISFKEFMTDEGFSTNDIFEDNQVTGLEIIKLLDPEGDSNIAGYDLECYDLGTLRGFDQILKKHGFNLGKYISNQMINYRDYYGPEYLWENRDFVLLL